MSLEKQSSKSPASNSQAQKKSKGKLFQCTGYPGCSMVFTRSEHLARHIRKHTGERPFQCEFCFKKFSRLDNLRQHKQTVHQHQMNNSNNGDSTNQKLKNKRGDYLTDPGAIPMYAHPHHPHIHMHPHQLNKTPSIDSMNSLISPPNSVSPHINNRLSNSMLPPPRRNNLLQPRGYSEFRPTLSNKPVPIMIENSDSSTSSLSSPNATSHSNQNLPSTQNQLITPNSAVPPIQMPSMHQYSSIQQTIQQHPMKLHPSLYSTNSNFSSPTVSPLVAGFAESPSPYSMNFALSKQRQQQQQQPSSYIQSQSQQQPLSPQFYVSTPNIITPTNPQFEFQNNQYLSPVYYQQRPLPVGVQQMQPHYQNNYNSQQQQQRPLHLQSLNYTSQNNSLYNMYVPGYSATSTPTGYNIPIPEGRRPSQLINSTTHEDNEKEKFDLSNKISDNSCSTIATTNTTSSINTNSSSVISQTKCSNSELTSISSVGENEENSESNDVKMENVKVKFEEKKDTLNHSSTTLSSNTTSSQSQSSLIPKSNTLESENKESKDSTSNDYKKSVTAPPSSLMESTTTDTGDISNVTAKNETKRACIANLLNG